MIRVLQHARALHVAVAVKPRGETEVALEERTGGTEQGQDGVGVHGQ